MATQIKIIVILQYYTYIKCFKNLITFWNALINMFGLILFNSQRFCRINETAIGKKSLANVCGVTLSHRWLLNIQQVTLNTAAHFYVL